jgi:D-alanyl-D-alanine carboxypeptidase
VTAALACLGVLLVGSAGGTDSPAATNVEPTRADRLRDTLNELVSRSRAPGGVLLVQTPNSMWRGAAGLARKSPRQPMAVAGRFRVASITKTFTATVVLGLVADGKLALGDTVAKWLPGRLPTEAGAEITVRDLLSHRSGLTDAGKIEPRGRFRYADGNFLLLGEIVEAVTSSPFEKRLAERILEPLRLTRTELRPSPPPDDIVHGYLANSGPDVTGTLYTRRAAPAAALVSTAVELARFERALLRGRVIPPRLVKEMQTSITRFEPGYGYGLGLSRSPTKCGAAWGHAGRTFGYTGWMLSTASGKRTVVALLNTGVSLENPKLWRRLERLVTQALCA